MADAPVSLNHTLLDSVSRRHFLGGGAMGLGAAALGLLNSRPSAAEAGISHADASKRSMLPMFAPKAKRIIYLHMAGAPSQLELFDYKPELARLDGQPCPESFLKGKQFAFITGKPSMLGPIATFAQYGQSRAHVSNHLPYFSGVVDDVTFLKAVHTEEFNHAPAQLMLLTGNGRPGRPGMGAWMAYGLGSENENLPAFVVLLSGRAGPDAGKAAYGSGFLPSVYQGVKLRAAGDPVLYLSDPAGMDRELRRRTIEQINAINAADYQAAGDPEILTRISQYEMAFRMQTSVPEAMDIWREPEAMHKLYGTTRGKATFSNNCLLARRLVERGVRFIQLHDWGWDSHGIDFEQSLRGGFLERCKHTDQGMAALVTDLKQRGLLEDTLIVWGTEFGRTPMRELRPGVAADPMIIGRDHHREAFTMWMAGAGVQAGLTHGATDEFGYYGVSGRAHVHDVQATILHLMGLDHERLTYPFQGRNFRLTDVAGQVIKPILA
jgi:hypothetical protein